MNTSLLQQLTSFMKGLQTGDRDILVTNLENVVAYLSEKVTICEEILEEKTGQTRLHLSDDQKRRLAQAGRKLNEAVLAQVEHSFQPDTVLGWYRQLVGDKYNSVGEGQKKRGRKAVTEELRDLILKIARSNPNWGYKRIASYLVYLGHDVTFMTVKRVVNNYGIFPPSDGRRSGDWQQFIDAHRDVLASCDFATCELATPAGLQHEHILFFENVATREVWCGGVAHDPDGRWMAQVGRDQCDMVDGKLLGMKYLVHDGDPLFKAKFPMFLDSIGCQSKCIPPRMPECNGHIESFIKTFKTECIDHLVLTTEAQLRYVVREFLLYYNHEQPHSALGGRMIQPWPQDPDGEVREFRRLGGLLKSYRRVKNAA